MTEQRNKTHDWDRSQWAGGTTAKDRNMTMDPDAELFTNANYLRTSCHAVDSAARVVAKKVCRRCAARDVQAAFEGYRQMLPSLSRGAGRCAMRLGQLARGTSAAKRLRHDVRDIGNPLILTLRGYEARLAVVRKALNITPPTRVPTVPAGPAHR